MANVLIEESTMHEIGDTIREFTGKSELILPANMPVEIRADETVRTQAEIMQQIRAALAEKSAGDMDTSSENPATESDIVAEKEAFVNGEPVVGTMKKSDWILADRGYEYDGAIYFETNIPEKTYIEERLTVALDKEIGTAYPEDVPKGVTFTSNNYFNQEGTMEKASYISLYYEDELQPNMYEDEGALFIDTTHSEKFYVENELQYLIPMHKFGNAQREQVAKGVFFTSSDGFCVEGTGLVAGGGSVFPDGAFAPVTSFTDGKQYALVSTIDGVKRYINTTTYNDYTMNATTISISEDAGDYVIFNSTPVLFTAVASGNGFLLQNGSNYLHGTTNNGTALRFGTTQAVWTIDTSATGGFSDGKYHAKEDSNAVWLKCNDGNYDWCIKFESAGSFGYDRDGRDNTYSTRFTPFVLYEYVAGEGEISPIMDTSEGNLTSSKMLEGAVGFSNGQKVEGNIKSQGAQTITPATTEKYIESGVYLSGRQTIGAIQTETGSATQSGTYYPSSGKYFSSFTVSVQSSGSTVAEGDIVRGMEKTSFQLASGYQIRITYSANYDVSNGSITLTGTSTLSSPSNAAACDVLIGKYLQVGTTTGSSSSSAQIYYIPKDATFTVSGSSSSKTVSVSKCCPVFVFGGEHVEN